MIHLVIKAKSLADAMAAANSRDIEVFALRSYHAGEVLASCEHTPENVYRVAKWFCDRHTEYLQDGDKLNMEGSLLYYTWPKEEGHG